MLRNYQNSAHTSIRWQVARAAASSCCIIKMAAEVEGQFAGVEVILQQAETRAFADGRELGSGLLTIEERRVRIFCAHSTSCTRLRSVLESDGSLSLYDHIVTCAGGAATGQKVWY